MKKKILAIFTVVTLAMTTTVMGASTPSKTEDKIVDITIGGETVTNDGQNDIKVPGGTVTITDGRIQVGETVTLTINPDDGKSLSDWGITGDYTIVDGSLSSPSITIKVNGNISIDPKFADAQVDETTNDNQIDDDEFNDDEEFDDDEDDEDDEEDEEEEEDYKGDSNGSTKSPKTGLPVAPIAVALIGASGVSLVMRKKED
ncbi:MAG: hypothetical protein E7254_10355 [Lachnospiraceae bacterium]|nr:hypothetical protein [Lachnospiraceae bacterium]